MAGGLLALVVVVCLGMLWLLLFVIALVPTLLIARRAYNREVSEMTPEEREEERYQMQVW